MFCKLSRAVQNKLNRLYIEGGEIYLKYVLVLVGRFKNHFFCNVLRPVNIAAEQANYNGRFCGQRIAQEARRNGAATREKRYADYGLEHTRSKSEEKHEIYFEQ